MMLRVVVRVLHFPLPRFRYDQLMQLGWKGLVPLALANIVVTGLWICTYDAMTKT